MKAIERLVAVVGLLSSAAAHKFQAGPAYSVMRAPPPILRTSYFYPAETSFAQAPLPIIAPPIGFPPQMGYNKHGHGDKYQNQFAQPQFVQQQYAQPLYAAQPQYAAPFYAAEPIGYGKHGKYGGYGGY